MKTKTDVQKAVCKSVENYLLTTDENTMSCIHQELIQQVEQELLATVLKHTDNNQTITANILGLSRTTLRKKIKLYEL